LDYNLIGRIFAFLEQPEQIDSQNREHCQTVSDCLSILGNITLFESADKD
jgi:hypothetical protein